VRAAPATAGDRRLDERPVRRPGAEAGLQHDRRAALSGALEVELPAAHVQQPARRRMVEAVARGRQVLVRRTRGR
jgi:hypothetical protein